VRPALVAAGLAIVLCACTRRDALPPAHSAERLSDAACAVYTGTPPDVAPGSADGSDRERAKALWVLRAGQCTLDSAIDTDTRSATE